MEKGLQTDVIPLRLFLLLTQALPLLTQGFHLLRKTAGIFLALLQLQGKQEILALEPIADHQEQRQHTQGGQDNADDQGREMELSYQGKKLSAAKDRLRSRLLFNGSPAKEQIHSFFRWISLRVKIDAICHTVPAAGGKGKNCASVLSSCSGKITLRT